MESKIVVSPCLLGLETVIDFDLLGPFWVVVIVDHFGSAHLCPFCLGGIFQGDHTHGIRLGKEVRLREVLTP